MNILVSGSLAYDRIMDFQGRFSDHILPEKIHVLNVSFTVNSLTEKFGGTAGNIAYGLSLLGEKPLILATIGRDYHRYFDWLMKNHISHDGIRIIEQELTAGAYITTDQSDNQITGFNPGAMKFAISFDFSKISSNGSIAIIAPGNMEDMMNCSALYKSKDIDYIFDPGQSLPMWDSPDLIECIDGSRIMISNDYELELIISKTGLDKKRLLQRTDTIITTLGEFGSRVCTRDSEIDIPATKPKEVVDPTGAGDAYRAGLIKGLVKNLDIKQSAEMGSVCASFAVECYGTQDYYFSLAEFEKRLVTYRT
ncbi:MAG: carbohydrate kinase family protein [Dehalococcoidales bacterium]|nr:carbohydrate kinase family protein [Dehalococcoidales bacterium]